MAFSALDTSQNSRNLIPCMGEKGITAVGRYYTKRRTNTKILTADEARRLSDAGITIWTVYQNRHRELVDFSSAKGKQEAEDALDYARNVINQPPGSAIYFSADFDASQATFNNAIRPHFEAIVAAFAAAGNPYRIGVYSSGAVCKSLLDAGLVKLTWLSQSSGFRGTADFKISRRWNILQALPVANFCNFDDDVDPNEINGGIDDFGGFSLRPAGLIQPVVPPLVAVIAAAGVSGITLPANPEFPGTFAFRGTPLHRGEVGSPDVKAVQSRLNDLRFGPLVVDGDFGEGTQNAVLHFQARNSSRAENRSRSMARWVKPPGRRCLVRGPSSVPRITIPIRPCGNWSSILRHLKSVSSRSRTVPIEDLKLMSTSAPPASIRLPETSPGACASCTGYSSRPPK